MKRKNTTLTILFGLRCQQLRKSLKLSQEKFALLVDMDRTYYASIETGKRNVSLNNIKKISDGFGLSLSKFFETM